MRDGGDWLPLPLSAAEPRRSPQRFVRDQSSPSDASRRSQRAHNRTRRELDQKTCSAALSRCTSVQPARARRGLNASRRARSREPSLTDVHTGPHRRRELSTNRAHWPLWIDNAHHEAIGGATLDIEDPATGETVATCAAADAADVDAAVKSGQNAWAGWRQAGVKQRGAVLRKAAALLRDALPELVDLETKHTGRPKREYAAQLGRVPEWYERGGGAVRDHSRVATPPRPARRGYSAENGRDAAAAGDADIQRRRVATPPRPGTWIFSGDGSVGATPRLRGSSVGRGSTREGLLDGTRRYHAALAETSEGRVPPLGGDPDHLAIVRREPLGVCGLITPFNHPLLIASKNLAPCLATGNVAVVKAPELAPASVLRLAEIFADAGAPPGVVNVVPGEGVTAGAPAGRQLDAVFCGVGVLSKGT